KADSLSSITQGLNTSLGDMAEQAGGGATTMLTLAEGVTGLSLTSLSAVGVVIALAAGLMDAANAAAEAEVEMARAEGIIESMANKVGVTSYEVDVLARNLAFAAGQDDEATAGMIAFLSTLDISKER